MCVCTYITRTYLCVCVCILNPLQSHNIWQARGIFYTEPPPVARKSHPLPPSRCHNAAPKGCSGGPDRPPGGSRSCRVSWFFPVVSPKNSGFPSCWLEKNRETHGFYDVLCFSLSKIRIEQHKLAKRWWKTGRKKNIKMANIIYLQVEDPLPQKKIPIPSFPS